MANTYRVANLSLSAPTGNLLNCLGIQPLFIQDGVVKDSYLGFVYRLSNLFEKGKMKYMFRYFNDDDYPIRHSFDYKDSSKNVVNFLLNNSFTLKHNGSLDVLMENTRQLKKTLLFYLERIHYYTVMCQGNFIITSRKDLYNTPLFGAHQVHDFMAYLVSQSLLPRNIIILGHKNLNSFCNPFVAAPLIDKNHFMKLCDMNDINLNDFKNDPKRAYGLIEKHLNYYSLYQSYLDNVEVPKWYIEKFANPPYTRQIAYYTTLYFD